MTPNAYAIIFGVNVVFRLFLSNFHPGSDALAVVVARDFLLDITAESILGVCPFDMVGLSA
jgi:hypothetical protein